MEKQNSYRFLEGYQGKKAGTLVSINDIQGILESNYPLLKTYAKKTGQGDGTAEVLGPCRFTPDDRKIMNAFLEDLVSLGIIEQIKSRHNKRWH